MMDSSAPPATGVKDVYSPQETGLSRRWITLSVLSIVLIITGYFLLTRVETARTTSAKAAAAAKHPGVPVSVAPVKRGDLNRYLSAIGTVTAFNTVTVKTRAEPMPAAGGHVYHVYPRDWKGAKEANAFNDLMCAYNYYCAGGNNCRRTSGR